MAKGGDPNAARKTAASMAAEMPHTPTGVGEFDKVIGGGLVEGTVILFGGEKGSGKTTLMLLVADALASARKPVLYATAEQRSDSLGHIAHRVGVKSEHIEFMGLEDGASDIDAVIERMRDLEPALTIVDSVQMMTTDDVSGSEGSSAQGLAVMHRVGSHCGRTKQCAIMINHLTKDGQFAGSESVGHGVDCTLQLEYQEPEEVDGQLLYCYERRELNPYRVLRIDGKSRLGAPGVAGYFEIAEGGLMKPWRKKSKLIVSG